MGQAHPLDAAEGARHDLRPPISSTSSTSCRTRSTLYRCWQFREGTRDLYRQAARLWSRVGAGLAQPGGTDGGLKDGTSTEDARRIKELEQEVKELRRANEILCKARADNRLGEVQAAS